FITQNLKYPPEAIQEKVEGTVLVRFVINHLGKVTETHIVSGLGHGCDEEAQRVIKLLQFETDKNRGFKSKSSMTLGVHFKVKANQSIGDTTYQYTIVPKKSKDQPKEEGDVGSGYSYTIEW
ncbi:MAG: energy transducer TonB, partial [Bacteroidota bacterium]